MSFHLLLGNWSELFAIIWFIGPTTFIKLFNRVHLDYPSHRSMIEKHIRKENYVGFNAISLTQYDFFLTTRQIMIDIEIQWKRQKTIDLGFLYLFWGWPTSFKYHTEEWTAQICHHSKVDSLPLVRLPWS